MKQQRKIHRIYIESDFPNDSYKCTDLLAHRLLNVLRIRNKDEVIIFNDTTPEKLIYDLKPNIFVKGSEFTEAKIRETDKVPEFVKIKTFPMKEGYSTTSTIKKIKKLKSAKKK